MLAAGARRLLAAHVDPDGNPERRRLVEATWGGIERRSPPRGRADASDLIDRSGGRYALAAGAETSSRVHDNSMVHVAAMAAGDGRERDQARVRRRRGFAVHGARGSSCSRAATRASRARRCGHADRLLRLRTLYMSDDARDLVAIVGERYKEDIARFGYVFPENSSAPTMRT